MPQYQDPFTVDKGWFSRNFRDPVCKYCIYTCYPHGDKNPSCLSSPSFFNAGEKIIPLVDIAVAYIVGFFLCNIELQGRKDGLCNLPAVYEGKKRRVSFRSYVKPLLRNKFEHAEDIPLPRPVYSAEAKKRGIANQPLHNRFGAVFTHAVMSKGIIRIAFITRLVLTGGSTSGYAAYEYKPVYLLIPTGQAQIFSGIDVCLSIGRKGNSPHNPGAMEKPMGLPFTVRIKIREGRLST